MTLSEMYEARVRTPSDINELLPILRRYSNACNHVTEFGVRGIVSTVALLGNRAGKKLVSYDITSPPEEALREVTEAAAREGIEWRFIKANDCAVTIDQTDFLFIDTVHIFRQLQAELARHAGSVRRWIAMHDTVTFGDIGEGGELGLEPAIFDFLAKHQDWRLRERHYYNNGLTIIERR